ncbi:hypothetical protein CJF32_00006957 [Rutstroemia sp. NJR-2017a WRK4]|nr:hypothetical protein CJF32_00006957 [Rutstroemia sp. NJR-2017a WRK4]
MDDPWGSPWADELDNDNDNGRLDSQRINDNVAGNTGVENASNALRNKLDATWDNPNDGFTDWEADTGMGAKKGENLGLDAAADQWDIRKPDMQLAVGKDDMGGFESQWNDFERSPGREMSKLAPSPMAKPRDIAREPSPDPWANAVVPDELQVLDEQKTTTGNESTIETNEMSVSGAPEPVFESLDVPEETAHEPANIIEDELLDDISMEEQREELQEHKDEAITPTTETVEPLQTHEEETEDSEAATEIPEASNDGPGISEPGHESSRPSSSPSEGSHHDEPLPDSPRTSLDEEPKKPQVMREVEPEVQEQVEHPDEQNSIANIDERNVEKSTAKAADDVPESQLPKISSGPVDFVIDLTAVDKIFEKDDLPVIDSSAEKVFIPDTIIADTFATTGERKTWYRISRYGPMRKHNAGDDENYVRITWAQSTVKQDTQKIVARWMEEDRNNGHVVLGGTSKGGSVFGWNDPNAAPVPLAAVFAKRNSERFGSRSSTDLSSPELPREWPKNLTRDRSKSKTRSSESRTHSPVKSVDSTASTVEVQPSTADFDLDAFENTQTASESGSPAIESDNDAAFSFAPAPSGNPVPSTQASSSRHSIEPPPQDRPLPKSRPLSMPPPKTGAPNFISIPGISTTSKSFEVSPNPTDDKDDDDEEEDDEWGEMVSSPIVTEAPKLPPPTRSLRHKKSQSLGTPSFFIPNSTTPPLKNPQITKLQSGFHRKPKITFDEIIAPQGRNPPPPPISTSPILPPQQQWPELSSTKSAASSPALSPVYPPSASSNYGFTKSDLTWPSQPSSPASSSFADLWDSPPVAVSEARNMEQQAPASQITYMGNQSQPPSASTPAADPWASADFSFFDAPAPAPAPSRSRPQSQAQFPPTHSRVQSLSHPPKPLQKSVTWSTPPPAAVSINTPTSAVSVSSVPYPRHSNQGGKSKLEVEQDELVRGVVGGLPDLGYMFRR